MLGCSVGNSKSQLHKAKLRIRELGCRRHPRAANCDHRGRAAFKTSPAGEFDEWDLALASAVPMQVPASQKAGPIA